MGKPPRFANRATPPRGRSCGRWWTHRSRVTERRAARCLRSAMLEQGRRRMQRPFWWQRRPLDLTYTRKIESCRIVFDPSIQSTMKVTRTAASMPALSQLRQFGRESCILRKWADIGSSVTAFCECPVPPLATPPDASAFPAPRRSPSGERRAQRRRATERRSCSTARPHAAALRRRQPRACERPGRRRSRRNGVARRQRPGRTHRPHERFGGLPRSAFQL